MSGFYAKPEKRVVYIQATEHIERGQELLASYANDYWSRFRSDFPKVYARIFDPSNLQNCIIKARTQPPVAENELSASASNADSSAEQLSLPEKKHEESSDLMETNDDRSMISEDKTEQ